MNGTTKKANNIIVAKVIAACTPQPDRKEENVILFSPNKNDKLREEIIRKINPIKAI